MHIQQRDWETRWQKEGYMKSLRKKRYVKSPLFRNINEEAIRRRNIISENLLACKSPIDPARKDKIQDPRVVYFEKYKTLIKT